MVQLHLNNLIQIRVHMLHNQVDVVKVLQRIVWSVRVHQLYYLKDVPVAIIPNFPASK